MLEYKVTFAGETHTLRFEHSLLSVSKWEQKHKKVFLSKVAKTNDELMDYYQCMLLGDTDPDLIYALSPEQLEGLSDYMADSQTATTVPKVVTKPGPSDVMSSDMMYYWMTALKIDWRAEAWHLNRLLTLIQIISFKQKPNQTIDKSQQLRDYEALNEERLRKYGTTG